MSSRYPKNRWHTDARFDKWHLLRTLARLRGYPPDLTKAVLAGKIKHADAVRELCMERDQAQRSPEPETADAPEQGREPAPEPPAVPETAAPPAPEPESVRDPDSAPEPELACRKCGTPLARIIHERCRPTRRRLTILRVGKFRQSWVALVAPDRRFYANSCEFNVFRGPT